MTGRTWLKTQSRSRDLLLMSVLFFAALVPRLTAVNRYITPDELIWVFRSLQFRDALLSGRWIDTLTAGHPGVTTTWLGTVGLSLQLMLHPEETAVVDWVAKLAWFAPENMAMFQQLNTFLTAGRVSVALVNSAGIVLFFLLTRRLFGAKVAVLGSLLLAWDPFVVGLSGLLHVDGLLTTFVTLALLALGLSIVNRDDLHKRNRLGFPILMGVFTGLALLTKTPALLLLPFCGSFLFLSIWRERSKPFNGRVMRTFWQSVVWVGSFLVTVLLLFPALWISPLQVFDKMSGTSTRHIEEVLRPSFFMGEVAFEHGFLFYPVTVTFRLSPIVFCGLILAVFLIISALVRRQKTTPWFDLPAWIFILWPLLFMAAISVAAKKFDRYALPLFPALILVASLAWLALPVLKDTWRKRLVPILAGCQAVLLFWFLPYPLSTVNLAMGGPWLGQRVFDVGWGEAASTAAQWLAERPGATESTAVSGIPPAVAPFFSGTTRQSQTDSLVQADYVIVTLNGVEENADIPGDLIHTVRYNGLDRARIFWQANPQEPPQPQPLEDVPVFGADVALLAAAGRAGDNTIQLLTTWQLQPAAHGRYALKMALTDKDGHEWTQLETELLNESYFYPEDWQTGETPTNRYDLPLPPGLPPGNYVVEIALFAENGSQLPWHTVSGRGLAYKLPLAVEPTAMVANLADFEPPLQQMGEWLDGRLQLFVFADFPPELVVTGGEIELDLIWRAKGDLPEGLQVKVNVGEGEALRPLADYDTASWRTNEIIHQKITVSIPPEAVAGAFPVQVQPFLADDTPLTYVTSEGQVDVLAIDRLFELPADIPIPRQDQFDQWLTLAGADLLPETAEAGTTIPLTFYWQVEQVPPELVSVFVHLLGADEEIVVQSDQWPGGLPVDLWAEGQVITDKHLLEIPADLEPGSYQLAVGVYRSDDGTRLRLPEGADRVILAQPLQVTRP